MELQYFMQFRNAARMWKYNNKPGPSGVSRDHAFAFPESWGGHDYLLPVDVEVIRKMKADMGGDSLLDFVSAEFSECAQAIYDSLDISDLTFENI
jgi:hypothetical protein